jgi:hypothetical protein
MSRFGCQRGSCQNASGQRIALLLERTDRPDIETGRLSQVSAQHAAAVVFVTSAAGIAEFLMRIRLILNVCFVLSLGFTLKGSITIQSDCAAERLIAPVAI